MHRTARTAAFALLFVPALFAQEGAPGPAPELKKLAPLLGNWAGSGTMHEPSGVTTRWTAVGTYAWCLDGHFLQEDFRIVFEGMDAPMVFRAYLGWDRENARYTNVAVNNGGQAQLQPVHLLPDGSLLQMSLQHQQGLPYAERSCFKVDGDTMAHTIDMLMADGASLRVVDGKFTRGGDGFRGAFDGPTWMEAKPHDTIRRLAKSAGLYDVRGEMVMMPGMPATKITGTDAFTPVFGGTVVYGRTAGEAEGMPGRYVGDVFWAHDAARDCLVGVYVSNWGEVMQMEARWSPDGKLLSTSSALFQGQPAVQRTVLAFDADGAATGAVNHTIFGTAAPFESFRATYTKRK